MRVVFPPFSRNELVARLQDDVAGLAELLPLRRVALFGSWAADRATVASDIDLLVVYEGPKRDDAYRVVKQALPLRQLEVHLYTVEEAAGVQVVLERMTRGGIELWP
ncbi:MAG TPA: nucleotidyltransferase domain-containing protein [Chloroflexota bacterium]|nr:nucleotidyltransferase domain-containing protein [Chloroflexota bacterium]